MKSHEELLADLGRLAAQPDPSQLADYLQENLTALFASPYMAQYYQAIRGTSVGKEAAALPKLIVAWLAFLCGDNAGLSVLANHIHEEEADTPHKASFLYALKALSGIAPDPPQRQEYGRRAIEVLPPGDTSVFMANAKLTYAQLLAGLEQYRTAAGLFSEAYRLFLALDMSFPAAVALTNELLNRYRLGQLLEVIDKGERALAMASSFHGETHDYWSILHLPLGMCHFELNKASLAEQSLRLAQNAITQMGLFHMHGLVEYYLFKVYCVLGDQARLAEVVATAEQTLGNMRGSAAELLVCIFRVICGLHQDSGVHQSDIERLEVAYLREKSAANWILFEALALLKVKGLSHAVSAGDLVNYIDRLRYTGMIPLIQLFLLFLAEVNCQGNNHADAVSCLKEAVAISKEYGISVHLHTYRLTCLDLLRSVDAQLYHSVATKGLTSEPAMRRGALLSAKEKEILELVALGKSNADISQMLFLSVGTVKWHMNHILAKLEARNRVEAVQKGKALGEIS